MKSYLPGLILLAAPTLSFAQAIEMKCGTLRPKLEAFIAPPDQRWFWGGDSERVIQLSERPTEGTVSDNPDRPQPGYFAHASFKTVCDYKTTPTTASVEITFEAAARRNGNCIHKAGSCASASPLWLTSVTARVPTRVRVDVRSREGPVHSKCTMKIGTVFGSGAPGNAALFTSGDIDFDAGANFDVRVECDHIPSACVQGGQPSECVERKSGVGLSIRVTAVQRQ